MTYEIYRYIFIGAAILCAVMFIVSVLIFIFFRIPKVISDLSGATARRAIKDIREQNEKTGDKAYKASAFNEARGKLTDKISASGNLIPQNLAQMRFGIETSKIETQELPNEGYPDQTTVLEQQTSETTVLGGAESGATTVLSDITPADDTTILGSTTFDIVFVVEYDITFIHTNEIIELEAMG